MTKTQKFYGSFGSRLEIILEYGLLEIDASIQDKYFSTGDGNVNSIPVKTQERNIKAKEQEKFRDFETKTDRVPKPQPLKVRKLTSEEKYAVVNMPQCMQGNHQAKAVSFPELQIIGKEVYLSPKVTSPTNSSCKLPSLSNTRRNIHVNHSMRSHELTTSLPLLAKFPLKAEQKTQPKPNETGMNIIGKQTYLDHRSMEIPIPSRQNKSFQGLNLLKSAEQMTKSKSGGDHSLMKQHASYGRRQELSICKQKPLSERKAKAMVGQKAREDNRSCDRRKERMRITREMESTTNKILQICKRSYQ
ncbi:uncharacterized protein LOC133192890 [Saccostrea echinata]|uniref:uncharacterized protein LOC133192890 n=1 Tax=Saccostrea echinata TaxID=191078 RepID=UPI002A7F1E57|nr:uncharacterized protein LOC133192890 [Saccostrea echinata]